MIRKADNTIFLSTYVINLGYIHILKQQSNGWDLFFCSFSFFFRFAYAINTFMDRVILNRGGGEEGLVRLRVRLGYCVAPDVFRMFVASDVCPSDVCRCIFAS